MVFIKDYWETYPAHKIYSPFSNLNSDEMWGLYLMFNPSKKNPLSSMDTDERREEILKYKPKLKLREDLKEDYINKILTSRLKKELLFYIDQAEQRRKYIDSISFEDNDKKDKMLIETPKFIKALIELTKAVEDEESAEAQVQGGRKESLSEQKLI